MEVGKNGSLRHAFRRQGSSPCSSRATLGASATGSCIIWTMAKKIANRRAHVKHRVVGDEWPPAARAGGNGIPFGANGAPVRENSAALQETGAVVWQNAVPICHTSAPVCRNSAPVCHFTAPICRITAPICRNRALFCQNRAAFSQVTALFCLKTAALRMARKTFFAAQDAGNHSVEFEGHGRGGFGRSGMTALRGGSGAPAHDTHPISG